MVGGLLQNLGSGLLTSLFLIAINDRIWEQRLAAEASARERTVLRKLRHAMRSHVRGLLFSILPERGEHEAEGNT